MVVAIAVKAVKTAEDRHIRSGGLQRVWQPSARVGNPIGVPPKLPPTATQYRIAIYSAWAEMSCSSGIAWDCHDPDAFISQ